MPLDAVATCALTDVGDLLGRTHVVSVGRLLRCDPGCHVVSRRGAVASVCVFAVSIQKGSLIPFLVSVSWQLPTIG